MIFMRQGFSEVIEDRVSWTRLISVIGRKFVWLVILDIFSGVSYYLWLLICLLPKKLLWWKKLVLCMGCLSYFFLKSFVSFVVGCVFCYFYLLFLLVNCFCWCFVVFGSCSAFAESTVAHIFYVVYQLFYRIF